MMHRLVVVFCLAVVSACILREGGLPAGEADAVSQADSPLRLVVFAAASLTEAFTEIARQFEAAHPGVTVVLNFAGSQQLAQQLAQGAPADVFASADAEHIEAAILAGRIADSSSRTFAKNRLVVIYPAENPASIEELKDLAWPGLKLVLAAEAVPAGRYSIQFLERADQDPTFGPGFLEAVQGNVVSYEENVRAVLSKVQLGEADAGIVYTSDLAGESAAEVGRIDIPDDLNPIAMYYITPVSDSQHQRLAAEFVQFVLSSAGQAILVQYGFGEIG